MVGVKRIGLRHQTHVGRYHLFEHQGGGVDRRRIPFDPVSQPGLRSDCLGPGSASIPLEWSDPGTNVGVGKRSLAQRHKAESCTSHHKRKGLIALGPMPERLLPAMYCAYA
jgi:hypothetical protein